MSEGSTRLSSQDAATCKLSAIRAGYLEDDYLSIFHHSTLKKMPIMNRGTYARVKCISLLVDQFLSQTTEFPKQVIILGCGIDSLGLNLMKQYSDIRIFEVDFEDTIEYKLRCMFKEADMLRSHWPSYSLSGSQYGPLTMIGGDLRHPQQIMSSLLQYSCDSSLPTLIISECVLVYLQKDHCFDLLQTLAHHFHDAAFISYDMLNPNDRFGYIMQQNIAYAGYNVPGFHDFPSLESQELKFVSTNWSSVKAITMLQAYDTLISKEEQKRVSRLEIFDEIEEWQMLMCHYSLTLAVRGSTLSALMQYFCENTHSH